jgi:NADH-quinone oxidoreductase subunit J
MLLNLNAETEPHKPNLLKFSAVIAAGLLMLVIVASLRGVDAHAATGQINNNVGLVKELGKELYTNYIVPFEISSILFIAAMVGAVMLGKKELS